MDFKRSLFVRGLTWDSIPTVDSLNEHFTCKYMNFVYFFVSIFRLQYGEGAGDLAWQQIYGLDIFDHCSCRIRYQ